jgi:meso-butanediol dehydrogenase / (S,S)-butanediol dehydrogenase / diacetyl reductase
MADKKVWFITGAGRGLGIDIAQEALAARHFVVATGRNADRVLQAIGQHDNLLTVALDITDPDAAAAAAKSAVDRFGRIDVLVNNAGVAPSAPVLELRERQWRETLAVNLDAPFVATQAAARHMVEHGVRGAIVNIASTDAFHAEAPQADYNTSKAALVMMSRSFALELGHLGIRVNCVAPGQTATPMVEEELRRPEFRDAYLRRIPARRVGRPEEIAAVVLFLASDEASFVNGETVVADGGQLTGTWYDVRDEPPAS